MKRADSKLRLCRETLQTLEAPALARVHGGQEPQETVVRPTDACPVGTSR
jgi:hypothetical protein